MPNPRYGEADDHVTSDPVKATTVRLDEATRAAVEREAARQDTNTSEFIRSAIMFRLGWLEAERAAQNENRPPRREDEGA